MALKLPIKSTILAPNDASGNSLNFVGKIDYNVDFNNQTRKSTIFVSQNDNLNVFGNDLINDFNLWNKPINEFCVKQNVLIDRTK